MDYCISDVILEGDIDASNILYLLLVLVTASASASSLRSTEITPTPSLMPGI